MVSRKTTAALTAALLFFVISSPMTYKLVDSIVGGIVRAIAPGAAWYFKVAEGGCPTNYGLALHAAVFGLVTYYLMSN